MAYKDHLLTRLQSAVVVIAVFLAIGTLLAPIVKSTYYEIFNGSYFLNVSSLEATRKTFAQDEVVDFRFCRSPRATGLTASIKNTRSFYFREEVNGFTPIIQRELPLGIEYEKSPVDCPILKLFPELRPNEPGTYFFCQSITFNLKNSSDKSTTFCSSEYQITRSDNV